MAYLRPQSTPRPRTGDTSLWEGYELVETPTPATHAVHALEVQIRLNQLKAHPDPIHVKEMQTQVYTNTGSPPVQLYLTTIHFSVIGSPVAYPIGPTP